MVLGVVGLIFLMVVFVNNLVTMQPQYQDSVQSLLDGLHSALSRAAGLARLADRGQQVRLLLAAAIEPPHLVRALEPVPGFCRERREAVHAAGARLLRPVVGALAYGIQQPVAGAPR